LNCYGKFALSLLFILFFWLPSAAGESKGPRQTPSPQGIPILLYHRLGPVVADSMTVTTPVFESHLNYLRENSYTIIPLRQLVNYYRKEGPPPFRRSVVIAADDGHKTVYTEMFPLIKKYRIPVTLFIYPSAISNAPYAMTWEQLREMKKSGLVDIQSHSYWHPNFNRDKKKMSPGEYDMFVDMQMRKSREKLEKELGGDVNMLAWPFGIYTVELEKKAVAAGYIAAFTIERRHSVIADTIMAIPRYIMTDDNKGKTFERMITNE
jgi:peptidoglycan/xylan/chitin deacetylase (PgdA/CDA1 family)